FYTQFFNVIRQANYVIARTSAMESSQISAAAQNRIVAEASFLRAFAYFELTNLYRDVPLYTEPVSAFSAGKGPTDKAEIYAFIKNDLAANIPALPPVVAANEAGRISRAAAIALLGKVYLFDGQYGEAAAQLGQLFQPEYGLSLYPDYSTLFTPLREAEFSP